MNDISLLILKYVYCLECLISSCEQTFNWQETFYLFLFYFFRQMTNLEDDVYSFGFILLEALVGPSVAARREAFLLHEKV